LTFSGAFTGDVSAEMLRDAGATAVIVGHSERRQYHGETDAQVAAKTKAAWRAGLLAIVCVGETQAQRESGHAAHICKTQILGSVPDGATPQNTAIAYEPIWAIGTGKTATTADIAQMHAHIRDCLPEALRILYGGSVKPSNARAILALEATMLVGAGTIVGALAGIYGQAVIDSYLRHVTGFPVASFAAGLRPLEVLAAVLAIVLAITAIPAWLASRVPPTLALDDSR